MEQKRLILAIGLSFVVMMIWATIFAPKPPQTTEQQPTEKKETTQVQGEKEKTVQTEPSAREKISETEVKKTDVQPTTPVKKTDAPEQIIRIETPLYSARITNQGAKLLSLALKNYREAVDETAPKKEMVPTDLGTGTILTDFNSNNNLSLNQERFLVDTEETKILLDENQKEVSFSWFDGNGMTVIKRFIFKPDTYLIGMEIEVQNKTGQSLQKNMYLTLVKGPAENSTTYGFEGPSALINGNLEQIDVDDIEDKDTYRGKLKWIAVQDRYFISSIIPEKELDTALKLTVDKEQVVNAKYEQPIRIESGAKESFAYQIYIGPKSMKLLRGYNNDLEKAIYFGWFDFLAKPCLWLMNFLYDHFIPNYGLAIIILTLITKAILWPLGTKSYKSMGEMKKLQPLIKEIREKYKNDKKKMNEETMALYRTYKINPLGGCLPMLVQLPVFFALYRMLYEAIELRHAPFFGWINDLSAPDRLFDFGITIPYMEPPIGIPVLTIVMGASMLLQQKMSPPMGDPAQAKMMMLMPIIFTVIFINFSSGLVLYWLINNLVSMGQQFYIQKKTA